jgi:protein ImuB
VVSIALPHLAIERWAKSADQPEGAVALVVEAAHGQLIHAVTRAAAERGAWPGMRLTDARALDPQLVAAPADPEGDRALLARLGRWASRWSPLVEVDGDPSTSLGTGLRLDASGIAHLFGGEAALLKDIERRFRAIGLTARVAAASTAGAAWALARFGKPSPLEEEGRLAEGERGEGCAPQHTPHPPTASLRAPTSPSRGEGRRKESGLAELLAPLPVAALRLSPHSVRTLERLGLKTIGALAGIERRSLARRFREADNPLDALDRALGRKPEPLTAQPFAPPPRATLRLAEPVADPSAALRALELLVPDLL